ncbi:MAG: HmuY family protein [Lautropia sp.]
MKTLTPGVALGALTISLALAGCGSSSDSPAPTPAPTPAPAPAPTSQFTGKATWTFALPAPGQSLCYDFDASIQTADCTGTAWDLKLTSGTSAASFFTNSGSSGTGSGGAFGGPFDHTWAELSTWNQATVDPVSGPIPANLFFADTASGVFTGTNAIQSAAFEYGLGGANDHLLYPNGRVFLITTDSASNEDGSDGTPVAYALQIVGYYGGAGGTASGYPKIRWVDRSAPGSVRTETINATAGWVYFDLASGTVSSETGTWHIAFNRYNVKLNGGTSGTSTVAGFVGRTPDGFYGTDGQPVAAAIMAATESSTLSYLTASDIAKPTNAAQWVKDSLSSSLAPAYKGTYPAALDYGWFTYYPPAAATQAGVPPHTLKANPDRASMIRSGGGNSFARMKLSSIVYADPNSATSAQTWTVDFDVQPVPAQ